MSPGELERNGSTYCDRSARWREPVLLAAVAGTLYFVNLSATHLWDIDEAIFSQAAREMYQRGDYVVPYFNGEVFPDKPPLMYWAMIAGYGLLGTTELAARLGSALAGVASVLVTYYLGRILFSPRAGLWAGLVLATSLNFNVIARAATPDAYLTLFSALAMLAFVRATAVKETSSSRYTWRGKTTFAPSWLAWGVIYAAMGIGVLTKGPVAVVLPTAV